MADWLAAAGLILGAYLLGSVSFAYIVGRFVRGVDIRSVGSMNAGALNTVREIGLAAGLLVLILDAAKGGAVVIVAQMGDLADWALYTAPIALVAGHNWPVGLGFRGGRGLAPVLGVSMSMLPFLTLLSVLPAAITIAASRSIVLGAAVGLTLVNALTLLTDQESGLVMSCGVLTSIVGLTHFIRRRRSYSLAMEERDWTRVLRIE